ncbi:hypothetical protein NQ315_000824 [Exocentrus adspersus]|uniref:Uncharacterized protein n=1 Tax=Exocentrus adspersus TaxID=1586481 RepID=A0AAV8WDT8_9CUCU|nr:hypothetical protein NQ315_000824 [Exocentrus adspersus]
MNKTNMLSAQKVKLHGMTSSKWTTKDKITQYKGLINLYTRDKKIIEMDTIVEEKKKNKELKNIQKEIEKNRQDLDNAIRGDKQTVRNILAEHKEIQLAFQNAPPQKIIDMIHQVTFTKRKVRDMLKYKMKLRSDKLIDLKLRQAKYADKIKYEGKSWKAMLPCEKAAHLITGKVQDAILKKEAAIYIRNSYKEMIAIMKKDTLYFDAILVSIRNDGISQGKCMINATTLGQLGTEYLDDRRQEFQLLETLVKRDMVSRKKDLEQARNNVSNYALNMKHVLRRDSDINLGKVELADSHSFTTIKDDFNTIESTLNYLKNLIFTPTIQSIYPCLQEQMRQKDRLTEFVEKCDRDKEVLNKKVQHAATMRTELKNMMIESTAQYKLEKQELINQTEAEIEKKKELHKLIESRYNLLAQVRTSLKHIQSLARLLSTGKIAVMFDEKVPSDTAPEKPEEDEIDGTKIIPELIQKFGKLINNSKEAATDQQMDEGYKIFEHMMYERSKMSQVDDVISEESLIETILLDAQVLSRDDIKIQSVEIVAMNSIDEDLIPVPKSKKKRKFT